MKKYLLPIPKSRYSSRKLIKKIETEPHDVIVNISNKVLNKSAREYLDIAANRIYNNDNKKAMQFLSKAYYSINSAVQPKLTKAISAVMKDISKKTGIPVPKDYYWQ
tara:strand:- start:1134 stop:1454 length:321 start_codon:yes stop_codon:yes gene_type:complete